MKRHLLIIAAGVLFLFNCHQPLPPEFENKPPNVPQLIFPEDGALKLPVQLTLRWKISDPNELDTLYCDVYLQKNNSQPQLFKANLRADTLRLDSLEYDSQYFWRVVVRDQKNLETTGPVWSFRTRVEKNNPPKIPSNPIPENHQTGVSFYQTQFSWSGGDPDSFSSVLYDIFLGTSPDTMQLLKSSIADTFFSLKLLLFNKKYYWQVKARDEYDSLSVGDVWDFTTESGNLVFWEPFDAYPVNQQPPVPPWTIANIASSIFITDQASHNGNGKSICLTDSTETGYSFIATYFSSIEKGVVSFYWKVSEQTDYFGMRLYSGQADTTHLGPQISIREGKLEYFSENHKWEYIANVTPGKWYFMQLVISCEDNLFHVYVNNQLKTDSGTWIGSSVPSIDAIYFLTFNNRTCQKAYVDEIKVISE